MEIQKLIDYCYEKIISNVLDGGECPDLDECQTELQLFERLATDELIRIEKSK